MSTIAANNITDAAGSGAPNFTNGLKLNTNAVLGPVTGDAPMYACRAWVNFDGTGTVAIRASGNVSSITDNGTGNYTVNFTTAMPDADYAAQVTPNGNNATASVQVQLSGSVQLTAYASGALSDRGIVNVSIFR